MLHANTTHTSHGAAWGAPDGQAHPGPKMDRDNLIKDNLDGDIAQILSYLQYTHTQKSSPMYLTPQLIVHNVCSVTHVQDKVVLCSHEQTGARLFLPGARSLHCSGTCIIRPVYV